MNKLADEQECLNNICGKCLNTRNFTNDDLNKTLTWLVNTQKMTAIKYNLTLPKPCTKLILRKDIYCLNDTERNQFIDATIKMYQDGSILNLTSIHQRYWPAGHKFAEFYPWHLQLCFEFDRNLQRYYPNLLMPT